MTSEILRSSSGNTREQREHSIDVAFAIAVNAKVLVRRSSRTLRIGEIMYDIIVAYNYI